MAEEQSVDDVSQATEGVSEEGESQSSKRSNSSTSKSFDWENPLTKLTERLERLKEKVTNLTYHEVPLLTNKDPLPTSEISQNLIKLLQESGTGHELPESSFEKVMEILDKDIEDCNLLINSMTENIRREMAYQEKIDEQRKIMNTLMTNIDGESSAVPVDISEKVNKKFQHIRKELNELLSTVSGKREEELTSLLAELTRAYLNESGTQGQYVEVTSEWDYDCIRFLVSNRIATWNDNHTHIKLYL